MTDKRVRKILVVDDEVDVRIFLKTALIEAGFEVVTAKNGEQALEEVKREMPDLISLDLVMPKKSGAKFYRDLHKNKEWAKIPVIIVTGHARDDLGKADLKELTMSGPGVYLEKPVKSDNYIAAIKKILKMDANEDEKNKAELVELQNELKNFIDDSDPETLKKLKSIFNKP